MATLSVRLLSSKQSLVSWIQVTTASIHTSSATNSRIKRSHTHKPYFHIKKTAKQPNEPITKANQSFIQAMINSNYGVDPVATYIKPDSESGSLLRPELQPWPRMAWDDLGEKTKRCGILARKIGVVPMWFNNGKRVAATLLQVRLFIIGLIW